MKVYQRLFNEANDTIKFWDIPEKLKVLTFDGDDSDLRLQADNESFGWSEMDEKEYDKVEKALDKFEVKGKGYTVYCSYDVSGYDYWMIKQEEPNYVNISVSFDTADFPVKELRDLGKAVQKAINFGQDIEYAHTPIWS